MGIPPGELGVLSKMAEKACEIMKRVGNAHPEGWAGGTGYSVIMHAPEAGILTGAGAKIFGRGTALKDGVELAHHVSEPSFELIKAAAKDNSIIKTPKDVVQLKAAISEVADMGAWNPEAWQKLGAAGQKALKQESYGLQAELLHHDFGGLPPEYYLSVGKHHSLAPHYGAAHFDMKVALQDAVRKGKGHEFVAAIQGKTLEEVHALDTAARAAGVDEANHFHYLSLPGGGLPSANRKLLADPLLVLHSNEHGMGVSEAGSYLSNAVKALADKGTGLFSKSAAEGLTESAQKLGSLGVGAKTNWAAAEQAARAKKATAGLNPFG